MESSEESTDESVGESNEFSDESGSSFLHLSRFSLSEMESSSMVSADDDESFGAQGFAMDIDGDGADGDGSDVGGGSLRVNEGEKEACGDGTSPVVQWIAHNYKEPDVRRVMTRVASDVLIIPCRHHHHLIFQNHAPLSC